MTHDESFVESLIFLGFQLTFSEFKILKPEAMRLHVDQCLWSNVGMPCINCLQSDDSFQRIKCWLACLRRPQLVWFQAVCHLALVVCSVSSIIFAPATPSLLILFFARKKGTKGTKSWMMQAKAGVHKSDFWLLFLLMTMAVLQSEVQFFVLRSHLKRFLQGDI